MGWFARVLRWLIGDRGAGSGIAPAVEADPYFAGSSSTIVKKPTRLGLDAGAFLPISREEITEAAKGRNLLANPTFGRLDLIPPVSDLRTSLIDRAMVTQGLLTPEELAEIHEVGEEMERVRPSVAGTEHRAALAGTAAVEAENEARLRLKAAKKLAAAQRREERRAAIAHRRVSDIVFLGRGVSAQLNDRQSDLARLAAFVLPELSTPAEVALALELSIPRLRWLAFHSDATTVSHYVRFTVPKRSGGTRTLAAPHRTLARAQRWILTEIVSKLPVETHSHGFVVGRSILTNAREHASRAIVVNLDLKDFFPSIVFPRVRQVFKGAGYSPAVATILALLCTECPRRELEYEGVRYFAATGPRGLPQGACTSPGLSNLVAKRLDRRLGCLAGKLGVSYTRYADDMTFSGDGEFEGRVEYLMARVRHIAADEGFVVNDAKSRVLRRNAAQMVTGLVVNERPGVVRAEVRRLRAILHRARTEGIERQNREGRRDYVAWLRGKIAFVGMARPEVGEKLRRELERVLG